MGREVMMTADRYAANETGKPDAEPDDIMGKIWWNFKQWHFKYVHGVSKKLFSQQVEGNTPLLKVMEKLHVTEKEATSFLKMFEKIDVDHSGSISLYEFFDVLVSCSYYSYVNFYWLSTSYSIKLAVR